MSPPPSVRFAAVEQCIRAAVSRVASTEPDPLDPFRGLYISDDDARRTASEAGVPDVDAALEDVAVRLGLEPLDTALLAVCAAPELDAGYGRLFAYLHDDVTRRLPTPRLAAGLLGADGVPPGEVLARFGGDRQLRRSGAVRLLDDDPLIALADRPVKLDERLAARLLGADLPASADAGGERLVRPPGAHPGRQDAVVALRRLLAGAHELPVVACGSDAPELIAWALERPVVLLDARAAADRQVAGSARVRAALEGAALVLDLPAAHTQEERDQVRAGLDVLGERIVACARSRSDLSVVDGPVGAVVEVPPPSLIERRELWAFHATGASDEIAAKFRLSIRQIEQAARLAALAACARGASAATAGDLEQGARAVSRTRLGELATLLDHRRGWDDLIVAEPQRDQLRSIAAYLRHRDRVLSEWGYEAAVGSQGLKVMFAGPSGTGKTLAAQVIATDLGLDAFRVDLATVVSKYIGETERNLDRIFAAAEGSNAILFFDEADALFGKRSEVKDAHDRYANIEVAYLLQRMEIYPGAVVLATNYRRNIDEAFLRRLEFVVEFPLPDPADRVRIWKRLIPGAAPVAPEVELETLATRFELSGGSIRNCSVAAAFMAADEGGPIEMRHLLRAVAAEYRKLGRLTLDGDFTTAAAAAAQGA